MWLSQLYLINDLNSYNKLIKNIQHHIIYSKNNIEFIWEFTFDLNFIINNIWIKNEINQKSNKHGKQIGTKPQLEINLKNSIDPPTNASGRVKNILSKSRIGPFSILSHSLFSSGLQTKTTIWKLQRTHFN